MARTTTTEPDAEPEAPAAESAAEPTEAPAHTIEPAGYAGNDVIR